MSGGVPEVPPGLEAGDPRPNRSRSAGATPYSRSSPIASTPTSSPTTYGPPGAAGVDRRAPGGQNQQPTPANP
eukprot:5207840-Alexandrium_andersonii.AAC.1